MAAGHDREDQIRAERARAIGLFRYSVIREAADRQLSTKQRGRLVRDIAEREHSGPFGAPVRISRHTIDRWIRQWRRGGFDALVPNPRRVTPRTPADVLDLAAALKTEVPARTAAQVAAILRAHGGWAPDERTLQRHFVRLELNTRPGGRAPKAFGRFEAEQPNQRWTGDALCRMRHNASYGDSRIMPTGPRIRWCGTLFSQVGFGIVTGCRGTP